MGACRKEIFAWSISFSIFLYRSEFKTKLLLFRSDLNGYETIDMRDRRAIGILLLSRARFIKRQRGQISAIRRTTVPTVSMSVRSDVMTAATCFKFKNDKERLKKEIDQANISFLHAPMFHPALKTVGLSVKSGVRTFFNMLGPMVNPASQNFNWSACTILKWREFIIIVAANVGDIHYYP